MASDCNKIMSFERNDLMVLNEIVLDVLGFESLQAFKADEKILAYQFNAMPNYYRSGYENNLHYKLLIHYAYSTTTIIYDSVTRDVVENRNNSTW